MKSLRSFSLGFIVIAALVFQGTAAARDSQQGWIPARVDDTADTHCILPSSKLTVTLRGVILDRSSAWFGFVQDKQMAITFTTTLTSSNSANNASFAKVMKEDLSQMDDGQFHVAQEQSLLSQYPLTHDPDKITTVDIGIGMVRTQGKSVGAQILLNAVSTTKNLSLPADAFGQAFNVASAYVTGVFQPLLDDAESNQEAVSHNITMNIDAANCTGDDEFTGTKAFIKAAPDPTDPEYIDINKDYCFQAQLKPVFVLRAALAKDGGSCDGVTGYTTVQNTYLAFYVNAPSDETPKVATSALSRIQLGAQPIDGGFELSSIFKRNGVHPATAERFSNALLSNASNESVAKAFQISTRAVKEYRESLKRCDANGTSVADCLK